MKKLILLKNRGDDICVTAAETLICLEPDNEIAIATCVEAININRNQYVREQAAVNLLRANHHCNLAIETFLEPIYHVDFPYDVIYNLIWHCAQNMTYLNFYRTWHS